MKQWLTTGFAVVAMALAGPAVAGKKPAFDQADKNGDGKVSVKEAEQAGAPKEEAKKADLDDDGKLTKADWEFVDMSSDSKKQSS